jgi:hypothetical protein
MTGAVRPDVTLFLERARAGDELARGGLIAQVYAELRRVAAGLMRREHPGHTLPPTAVVHAAVIRLLGVCPRIRPHLAIVPGFSRGSGLSAAAPPSARTIPSHSPRLRRCGARS